MFRSYTARIKNPRLALAAGLIVAALLQAGSGWIDPYTTQVIIFAAINVILAVSLNLVMGETGQFSLCHAAFMAVGAYTSRPAHWKGSPRDSATPRMDRHLVALPVSFSSGPAGGRPGSRHSSGLIVGGPSPRLRGDYLAMVTLGFGEIIRVLLQNTNAVGGARGMDGILPATNSSGQPDSRW